MELLNYKTRTQEYGGEKYDEAVVAGRMRDYQDFDVLEGAIKRAKYLFSNYDNIMVAFSGGKDSLVVLELMDMVRVGMGIKKKIIVFFWDEELISDEHEAFVMKYAKSGRFEFHWVVAQLKSEKFILGKIHPYIQWDITREYVREIPDIAEQFLDDEPCSEHDIFLKHFAPKYNSYALCMGLRASESLNRYRAVMTSKRPDTPYIVSNKAGMCEAKPIYDWQTKDIFKFFADFNLQYAPVYDAQTWSKANLRVATPFTNEGAKSLNLLKQYDPLFYNRLITVFPEMAAQERYYKDLDTDGVYLKYGVTKEGIYKYVEDTLSGRMKDKALKCLDLCFRTRDEDAANGRYPSRYPLYYIFYQVVIGQYKRSIKGIAIKQVTAKMLQYEPK